uniref:NADH dehydrogenase [ubiquinone] 1 alpha subcomplex subunit 12 n=3 Tax=Meloidogyne TaxID=189290 RepID=A0A915NX79_9BILA
MSNKPTRPGPWLTIWKLLWADTKLPKQYIGEDQYGNRYYELSKPRSSGNVSRGYDPAPGAPDPPVEWLSWTKMTRRFPPSEEEIRLNRARQQQQLEADAETEKRAPTVATKGGAVEKDKGFPEYKEKDFEHIPGAKKEDKRISDKEKISPLHGSPYPD